jgi:hypothetical protein
MTLPITAENEEQHPMKRSLVARAFVAHALTCHRCP